MSLTVVKDMLRAANTWPPYCLFTLVDPLHSRVSSLYIGLFISYTGQLSSHGQLTFDDHMFSLYFFLAI